jgi:hypothetical protein
MAFLAPDHPVEVVFLTQVVHWKDTYEWDEPSKDRPAGKL